MPKIKIPLLLKLTASGALLAFVLFKVDISALTGVVQREDPYLILLALAMSFAAWYINTSKWQVLLTVAGVRTNYWQLLRLNFIGLFYNLLLPGQVGGEVVKSVQLARMGVGAGAAAVSVVADRVTGLLAVLLLGGIGAALSPGLVTEESAVLPWMIGLTVILAAAAIILVTGHGWILVLSMARRIRVPIDQLSTRFQHVVRFALPTRSWTALGLPLLLSGLFQMVVVLINLLVCLALGIPLSFIQLLWIVAVVSLLQALPISIAGIGVREGAYVYLLQSQGVDGSRALALSLTLFAMQIAMALVGGTLQVRGLLRAQS